LCYFLRPLRSPQVCASPPLANKEKGLLGNPFVWKAFHWTVTGRNSGWLLDLAEKFFPSFCCLVMLVPEPSQ
jgi:hypothetical protein